MNNKIVVILLLLITAGIAYAAEDWNLGVTSTFTGVNTTDMNVSGNLKGGVTITSKNIGGVIYADQYATIQDAINASSAGDIIQLGNGNKSSNNIVINKERLTLRGNINGLSPTELGTTIYFTGTTGAVIDASEIQQFSFENFRIDGANIATTGILLGRTGTAHPWPVRGKKFTIQNINGIGLDLGGMWGVQDSSFSDFYISNNQHGIRSSSTGVKFFGGGLSTNSIAGLWVYPSSKIDLYGTVFSGNGIDLDFNGTFNSVNCYGCWFEESVKGIINSTTKNGIGGSILLHGALLHTASSNSLINGTGISNEHIEIRGGKYDTTSNSSLIKDSSVSISNVNNEGAITFLNTEYTIFDGSRLIAVGLEYGVNISQKASTGLEQFWRMGDGTQKWGLYRYAAGDERAFVWCTAGSGESDCSVIVGNLTQNGNLNIAGKLRIGGMNTGIVNHGSYASSPTAFGAGDTYYNTTANRPCYRGASAWLTYADVSGC